MPACCPHPGSRGRTDCGEVDNKGAPIQEAEDAEADESQHSSDPSVKYSIANCRKYRAIRRAGLQLDPMGVLRFAKRRTRRLLLLREQ